LNATAAGQVTLLVFRREVPDVAIDLDRQQDVGPSEVEPARAGRAPQRPPQAANA